MAAARRAGDPLADFRAGIGHDAGRLMSQHDRRLLERRHAVFDVVQVRVANAAGRDLHQNLIVRDLRNRNVLDLQSLASAVKYRCSHE